VQALQREQSEASPRRETPRSPLSTLPRRGCGVRGGIRPGLDWEWHWRWVAQEKWKSDSV